ncbi:glycosyltransferase family 4 protein [Flavobacterium psychroterrae]|uniref:Glycosyltransferase family 4 protein n=1 Tax=Flavobacterium psychroterrae TaxID=2133767 RepID=A0ABS5PFS3_9FLAO|nr:glycosyltransferase family 4 protein [Flavobacterium psychroterrae]MBS7232981.1 glycosyltransferase family 4 protein [Flavobacterium psychroterrae]
MKVLHISGAKAWGGNEQQLIYCIPALNSLGVENIVFGIKDTVLEKLCLSHHISFVPTKERKLTKFANFKQFKELVAIVKPDIIHLHTSNSLTFYVLSRLFLKLNAKIVFSKKAISASSSFISKFKYNSKGIDAIFCVSKSVENNFSEVLSNTNKKKLRVVPDCVPQSILHVKGKVNLKEKYNIDQSKLIVGNIANHTNAKDLTTFINTADYLVNELKRKDIVFFQIGEFSKLTQEYLNSIKEKNLEEFIIFTNKIEDASGLNTQFNIFLMTSQREGGPTSVLEAMYVGVPVVSTNVGIVPDVIKDGENGYITPIKDFKNLASKINLLLSNEKLKKDFIEKSKIVIENGYTASVIAEKTYDEYKKVINSK